MLLFGAYLATVSVSLNAVLHLIATLSPVQVTLVYQNMIGHGLAAVLVWAGAIAAVRARALRLGPIIAVAILLFAVSADQLLGILYPPPDRLESVVQPHPTRVWCHRPNATGVYFGVETRINSLGLREREFPMRKPEGELRVLFVGDSVTVGLGLNTEDSFSRKAEPILSKLADGVKVRTINAGCSGYATWQETDYVRNEGLKLSPDLVVLGFCMNDVIDVYGVSKGKVRGKPWAIEYPPFNHFSGFARMAASIADRVKADKVRRENLWTCQNMFAVPRSEWITVNELFNEPQSQRMNDAWARELADLDDFAAICESAHVRMLLVSFPVSSRLPSTPFAKGLYRRVIDWAARRGVPALDTTNAMLQWATEHHRPIKDLFLDDVHLSAEGAAFSAQCIAAFIARHQLVKGIRKPDATSRPPAS